VALGSSAAPTARRTALVAVGLALAVAGCSAGQLAQTASVQSTVDGASGQAGPIALRDISIAYPTSGRYQQGDSGRLEFVAVNSGNRPDRLLAIRTDAAGSVSSGAGSASPSATASQTGAATETPTGGATSTSGSGGSATGTPAPTGAAGSPTASATPTAAGPAALTPVTLPAQTAVTFGADGEVVMLVGLTRPLFPAEAVQITFAFEQAGEVTINVPVAVPVSPLPPAPTIDVHGEQTSAD
jgi:copper(I)-binding protein